MSTICQPSSSGYFLPPVNQPWGLISLDWSVANSIWRKPNQNDSTCEATSIQGCEYIKAQSPNTRCFIYHNAELALQAFESQRAVMYDPTKANWFLQYTDGMGNKNGTIYNEPGGPGDQFFWDYRVPGVADYYISSVLSTLQHPAVDGTFTDDITGFPAEHGAGPANMNMSDAEVKEVQAATYSMSARLIQTLVAAGKYNWQAFGAQDDVGGGIDLSSPAACTAWMSARCTDAYQVGRAVTMQMNSAHVNESVASFLAVRPPIAFLGYGWESDQRDWLQIFNTDFGVPVNNCTEPTSGVFVREWTSGNVTMDCNTLTGLLPL